MAGSELTRQGLARYKARGGLLGSARPGHWAGKAQQEARRAALARGRVKSSAVRQEQSQQDRQELCPLMREWRESGLSLAEIAARLNEQGRQTRQGKPWNAVYVCRFMKSC